MRFGGIGPARSGAPNLGFIPKQQREGRVDIFYARWWFRHNSVFWEYANRIKEVESTRLNRTDVPAVLISSSFLCQEFPALAGTALALRRRNMKGQTSAQTERNAYVGALKPLARHQAFIRGGAISCWTADMSLGGDSIWAKFPPWFCTAERIGSIRPHRSESTPARKRDPPGSVVRQGIDRIRLAPARFARPDPLRFAPPQSLLGQSLIKKTYTYKHKIHHPRDLLDGRGEHGYLNTTCP
ncbi:hypothetical protein Taro_036257 [Colocasia esculenta]|uniref:Uncharacterized protein n=1 Tax=Colocasia esculenta TaxID=4460 RepID=A0A843W2L7_COLES|nr:hypothetical protein [Colocasia esculenta]